MAIFINDDGIAYLVDEEEYEISPPRYFLDSIFVDDDLLLPYTISAKLEISDIQQQKKDYESITDISQLVQYYRKSLEGTFASPLNDFQMPSPFRINKLYYIDDFESSLLNALAAMNVFVYECQDGVGSALKKKKDANMNVNMRSYISCLIHRDYFNKMYDAYNKCQNVPYNDSHPESLQNTIFIVKQNIELAFQESCVYFQQNNTNLLTAINNLQNTAPQKLQKILVRFRDPQASGLFNGSVAPIENIANWDKGQIRYAPRTNVPFSDRYGQGGNLLKYLNKNMTDAIAANFYSVTFIDQRFNYPMSRSDGVLFFLLNFLQIVVENSS